MRRKNYKKLVSMIVFAIYMLILLKMAVIRNGISLHKLFLNGSTNLLPFSVYFELIAENKWYQFIYLFVGNIFWFIPFGVLLPLIKNKSKSIFKITLYGFILSLSIEIAQYVFGTGISEVDDLILNTFGVYIGCFSFDLVNKYISSGNRFIDCKGGMK